MSVRPPGLSEQSHAFRFGGLGPLELNRYYHLVRELVWSCWEQLTELVRSPEYAQNSKALTHAAFLATEVPRLEQICDNLLDQPYPSFPPEPPRVTIAAARARSVGRGACDHEVPDDNCAYCQRFGFQPGPAFWHCDLRWEDESDENFAFDNKHRTREEWEKTVRIRTARSQAAQGRNDRAPATGRAEHLGR